MLNHGFYEKFKVNDFHVNCSIGGVINSRFFFKSTGSVMLKKNVYTVSFFLILTVASLEAHSVIDCKISVISPVTDDMGHKWNKGEIVPVDIKRYEKKEIYFCSHGGSCIPESVNGKKVATLTNCKTGKKIDDEDYILKALK